MKIQTGDEYVAAHCNHGTWVMKITSQGETWATGIITRGNAKKHNEGVYAHTGEEITVAKSQCSFHRIFINPESPSTPIDFLTSKESDQNKAEVVSLEEAKRLSRLGWTKGQTNVNYEKSAHSSVYYKTDKKYIYFGYDAPNEIELRNMCSAVGLSGLNEELSISDIVVSLIKYCKKEKIKLSNCRITPTH